MAQLIEDLLALSRISRSEMSRAKVDLSEVARAVAAELQTTEPDRQTQFEIADGLDVEGDPRLLRIVLDNLLGNAWKFSAKRNPARIEFGAIGENGTRQFFVRDNGAGFDMTYAHKLFGTFQRLHANEEFAGTGIGLATVQRIINRHGGRISAEGVVGEGATFRFSL
jgi:light-regulated signal transduction histidine kinase (bacteriophytochrome)